MPKLCSQATTPRLNDMIRNNLLAAAAFSPKSLENPTPSVGHLPFAAWLIQQLAPKILVELGAHSGNSYLTFCQSVAESGCATTCYAVDTWQGDGRAGPYDVAAFNTIHAHNQEHYAGFSQLLRMTFDDAVTCFADESVGLLHLNGLHTYAAVRHDFESWLPKLAPGAVVLLHATNVRERNVGVWKFWEELQARYPNHLEFVHAHGLGVLQLNPAPDAKKLAWLQPDSPEQHSLRTYFAALGSRQIERGAFNELKQHAARLQHTIADRDGQIAGLTQAVAERDTRISMLISSSSWYVTKPLRFVGRALRGVTQRMRAGPPQAPAPAIHTIQAAATTLPLNPKRWGIMATQHTLFIAHLIAGRLQAHGWQADIMTEAPASFDHDMYVVICPQMFATLPPGPKRIPFQMEQSVSSRWFTDGYLEALRNSLAVLEYAMVNIDFMANKGIAHPHVHYLPIGASTNYGDALPAPEKTCDILFYGDSLSSPRRREMIEALKPHFNVHVASEVFGRSMQDVIKQARLVINLHYYENALLEMPRIQECLSLGVPVVSESAQDQDDYPELLGAVRFFEQGSIPAMLEAVRAALASPVPPETVAESVALSARRFAFMFDRFLLAMGFLPASHASGMSLPLPHVIDRVALSLPETIARRQVFEAARPARCVVFDGIRSSPGWVGCGLSYATLARHAVQQGLSRLTIMEDDVLLPPDFELKMAVVHELLDARLGQWDVFSGIVAALHPEVKILSVEVFKGVTFVTINKMTSMVFNVYGEKALQLLASWDPMNRDVVTNTIDRFLEAQADLRIVVALPFFVGHREEVHSTLWGFQNTQYNDMIANSEQSLTSLVLAHPGAPVSSPQLSLTA